MAFTQKLEACLQHKNTPVALMLRSHQAISSEKTSFKALLRPNKIESKLSPKHPSQCPSTATASNNKIDKVTSKTQMLWSVEEKSTETPKLVTPI